MNTTLRTSECVFELAIVLCCLAYFLEAQSVDYPAAKVPAFWTNNNLSALIITTTYFYPSLTTGYSKAFMRIILFKEISSDIGFGLGFVSRETTFFLAVATVYSEGYGWRTGNIHWIANRNKPVHENANLNFLPDGDLVLRDADGALVWSTNTSRMKVSGLQMMETGNLVLYDGRKNTVWQSFDYPTDTLLPGQKLMAGQKLVARASATTTATEWAEGSYYFTVNSQGAFAFYQSKSPQMYFKFLINVPRESTEPAYMKFVNGTLALYISSSEPSEPDAVLSTITNYSTTDFVRFEADGHFRLYSESKEPVDLLADFLNECDYPTSCGNFALCSRGQCSCPGEFAQDNSSNAQGNYDCLETNPVTCKDPQSQYLLSLKDVYYYNYVDPDNADLEGIDAKSCKEACLKNCSCRAALFRYYYNLSHGDCFFPSPVLSLTSDGLERNIYQSYAYIKISNGGENERGSPTSDKANQNKKIIGSSIGAFLLAFTGYSLWCYFYRRKKEKEEDIADYFDELSGMPSRFSYEDLKTATKDFNRRLGEGGFGTVFEGYLASGEVIAVKRLDPLGQGKKEFLAEVKTIGSIHHVNLVRLIGFCAEKLHRLLVYEFMCNGSLDKWIFYRQPSQPALDWQTRKKIILDIAKGLAYLHEECRQRIFHLDIKPQNILLDANLHAKISDFGLSKLIERDQSQVVTTVRGTPGYLAPEWSSSVITEKVDVYSFGIVVLEVVCGRKNLDRSQPDELMHLHSLVMEKVEEDKLLDVIDKYSQDMQLHGSEATGMLRLAIWCLQRDFKKRPSMSMVVKVLEGTEDMPTDLDYSVSNPTSVVAIRGGMDLSPTTATLVPTTLSGPR